jgi:hypothetical protein
LLIEVIVPDDGLCGGALWQHQQGRASRQSRASQMLEDSLYFHVGLAGFSEILG